MQTNSKHNKWLNGTLFRGRALKHSLSGKNVTVIDHSVAFDCLKCWGASFQHNGNTIRHVTDTAALFLPQPVFMYENYNKIDH